MSDLVELQLNAEEKMGKSIEVLSESFSGIRTGKASPALVENVTVSYYGAPTRLREIAGISTPEPRLIVINAYDPNVLGDIEKAILAANLGVTPMNDGRVIRIPIPELNEERRKDLVKLAHRQAEEARVAIRNVRREANDGVKQLQKDGNISEDERDAALEKIQELTDRYIAEVDQSLQTKEKDILDV